MGLWDPFQMAVLVAIMGVILTTCKSWDDPPSILYKGDHVEVREGLLILLP